ncbi:MAG: epoxyqueuosine reductase [Bacillota bacterium]|nr:epoxyqueuosine reductase [Bacillota bacterium]
MNCKELISDRIKDFVREYQKREYIQTSFGEPLVGIADAFEPEIQGLREVIGSSHVLPQDILPDAKAVIAYYVPFTEELALSNSAAGPASPEWARAYEELNYMFADLNSELLEYISSLGEDFTAAISHAASEFDQTELVSNWSHRHMAYAAGLGTFGINNMLITECGCCGRFNSIVTNLGPELLPPDRPMETELCLYKLDGSCGVCMANCPGGAIHPEESDKFGAGFSRDKCYEVCLANAARYPVPDELAPSYAAIGSEVCGKCITGSPCAFRNYR